MTKKIKSIKKYNQNYKNFSFSDPTTHAKVEFLELAVIQDENGNISEEVKYASDGEVEEKNTYTFNDKGKLMEHVLLYAVDDVTERRVLERNEKGFLISETKYYGDDSGESTKYEYDDKDHVTAILIYDEEGQFISREEIKYDEKGSLSERITHDTDKKITGRTTFSPAVENKIEETEFDAKGAVISKTVTIFDEKGKEVSSKQMTPDGKMISGFKNTYDERGNLVEKIYKDFYSKKLKYEYNEKDQLISQELFDDSGLLLRKNMYDYNDEGNVIAEQTYEMDTARGARDKHFGTRYEYEFY